MARGFGGIATPGPGARAWTRFLAACALAGLALVSSAGEGRGQDGGSPPPGGAPKKDEPPGGAPKKDEPAKTEEAAKKDEPAKEEDPADRVMAALEKSLSKIRTVDTAFVQEKVLKVFKKPVVLRGRIYIEFPDRLAWHVTEPVAYTLILEKDELRQWDEDTDAEQRVALGSNPVFKNVAQQLRVWFSGRYTELKSEFDVKLEAETPELRLGFLPREKSLARKAVRNVTVTFAADRTYVKSIRFEDTTGDVTTLRFSDTKLDQAIPESAWKLRGDR